MAGRYGRRRSDSALARYPVITLSFTDPRLFLYALSSFTNGLFLNIRGPSVPELARRLHTPPHVLGVYLGIGGITGGIFALPVGVILDWPRTDAHLILCFGLVIRAISVGAVPFVRSTAQLDTLAVIQV